MARAENVKLQGVFIVKKISAVLVAVYLVFAGVSAFAVTSDEISNVMETRGYTVVPVSEGIVAVMYQGLAVMIAVDGQDGDVSFLTYIEDVSADMLGLEFLNRFNNEVKFGRVYVDSDGDIALQMDRNASGGVTMDNIESDFEVFILLVQKFMSDMSEQAIV